MDRIELEAKTDRELLILNVQTTNELCEHVKTQNGRIRRLEDWRNWMTGGMALLTLLFLLVGGWLLSKV